MSLKIVAACGNGMGTSMIIKLKVQKIVKELGVEASVEALSMGQSKGLTNSVDIIIASKHLVSEFNPNQKAKIVGVTNLMDENEIKSALSPVLEQLV
ncbi:PTS sugar transporter subunit IIB [Mesomycoplasma ovipneumoniae]|uniref:Pentitol phosphotransferase enzyme II, B component n=1 Tax=Mesomycoplasma ovipneumoniae 14811 TaxID=1188239 RepID=A0A014KWJ4_9BACT|nr:PTS sugar transporter subunit IIB [Mesomycoplasma ovipneumoniae]EXU61376.1 Pentitol phosphotransferase enzyme II, B component [Mesomycoplasma ovipneumoniae 14811]MDO6857222.1 PTS sugar transporter subunit IIB [Mesomycoplasma ovipneumoniae]MDW2923635.1 PTS sugar transporter subunit IIB [Mesomycoplasma ovipneumoniae]MDW2930562.1 PTS sugar transporter subunit IIB [Mesomycoplasma ovipneumoniae]MDW2933218.1 PTS sugar transporter subunit IIB [Mesomycoplasma ovipneumoniae]